MSLNESSSLKRVFVTSVTTLLALGTVTVTTSAASSAGAPSCVQQLSWDNSEGTAWTFSMCVDGQIQAERLGNMGRCWKKYPVGTLYTGPESDCGFTASGSPVH